MSVQYKFLLIVTFYSSTCMASAPGVNRLVSSTIRTMAASVANCLLRHTTQTTTLTATQQASIVSHHLPYNNLGNNHHNYEQNARELYAVPRYNNPEELEEEQRIPQNNDLEAARAAFQAARQREILGDQPEIVRRQQRRN